MWFLVRILFWLSVVIALLPITPSRQETSASQLGATDVLAAANAAVSDIRQFCVRQPDACVAGSQAIAQFALKAETSAKLLYQFLSERKVSDQLPVTTKSPNKSSTGQLSSSTLTPTDLAAPWHGPQPRAEAEPKRPS
jgi:hypothetical protein